MEPPAASLVAEQHSSNNARLLVPNAGATHHTFDESRLVKPSDWDALDDDVLGASLDSLEKNMNSEFEAIKAELAAEKAAQKAQKAERKAKASCS